MKTRKEKLEFLKGLMTGKRKIDELNPPPQTLFLLKEFDKGYYTESLKTRNGFEKRWSEEDIKEYEKKHPSTAILCISEMIKDNEKPKREN